MASYKDILSHDIWNAKRDHVEYPSQDEIRLTYDRARMLCRESGITVEDVVEIKPRFCDFHKNILCARDMATVVILTIHWNLCIGTIGKYARSRPDLAPLLKKLEKFDACGEYLLTEAGHGLDARNLETTATLQADGSIDLHTPSPAAAKSMPPTSPWAGVPRVAVVFARLIAGGMDCGVKPFIVQLTTSTGMCPGVTSKLLPKRNGSKVLDHSITTFNHVRLSKAALLGSPARPKDDRAAFLNHIWRVSVGTLVLSQLNIPLMRQSAYIVGRYSARRHVAGGTKPGERVPILSFATQYRPILGALAQAAVYEAFAREAVARFKDASLPATVRHAIATCYKAGITPAAQSAINELADRCGWQGLYTHNQVIELGMTVRGNSIAEGDYLVLCIRLASEILLNRYALPGPRLPSSPLARHEAGVWREARETLASLGPGGHRGAAFNAHLLPRCHALVAATAHRMAYEAVACPLSLSPPLSPLSSPTTGRRTETKEKVMEVVPPELLRLFESTCVLADAGWYVEAEGARRADLLARQARDAEAALPLLDGLLRDTGAADWTTTAVIAEEGRWEDFVAGLPAFGETESESAAAVWHTEPVMDDGGRWERSPALERSRL
ncbi:hypothetical protein F5X96DRAFT_215689 [Biscogniauxia mediterranea]|nr:hypothetical protein F5X96DRAFT_215689 [Biscogniauxia mediterranea]